MPDQRIDKSLINQEYVHCVPQNVPPDLSVCSFVLAQCLSVRALQEMLANREHQAAGVS